MGDVTDLPAESIEQDVNAGALYPGSDTDPGRAG